MVCAAWPYVRGDLASARLGAAAFLDNLDSISGAVGRQDWAATWTTIGDAHCRVGDLRIDEGAFEQATEAWLCAITAFEVARRLVDDDDRQGGDVSAKLDAGIQRFESLGCKMERVHIAGGDQAELPAYYLPAGGPDLRAPAVICISNEEETGATLLGRLLPVVISRGMSVLVVSHDDLSSHSRGQSETLLSFCLDYLSVRPDVDATRIGVYGEGLSAILATDFAVSDRRVAAAVCDGGLWNWARTRASVRWMTRTADVVDEDLVSVCRSRLVRQLKCPVLVVAGGRGTVSTPEAIKLQADCTAARVDLELVLPRTTRAPLKEIENFVTSDDCVFKWLERKLMHIVAS
ncbi:alpha/beta hydrolase [Bradyrhizobium sp. SRL28]|uniref:alpha/beta hydrolase family protein n=1 Tax=Bradyrhizobium sp. SRL28 TaxID=2836178 RepID=UPI001BDF164C|nr:alpha/beta hydrolase [Bradyrhizobium sp. SRL28]MBT1517156.1 alpha/beta hydrolase [Bradyrhizobium sp. SRL28]